MHTFSLLRNRTVAVVSGAAVVVGLGAGGAVAADLITGRDIANGSVRGVDIANGSLHGADIANGSIDRSEIRDGSLGMSDLAPHVRDQLGSTGARGPRGPEGPAGPPGQYTGADWSIIDRNVIGGGDAFLRPGPSSAAFGSDEVPPMGEGSLGIRTDSGADKVAFGNQVAFVDWSVTDITELGFSVFTTGENNDLGHNMPTITFEIDPNLETSTSAYSSMVYLPANGDANVWTHFDATDDAQGKVWGLTGAAGTETGCALSGSRCTWSELQTALDDGGEPARVYTVAISKGRDFAFSGAVDALRINDDVYDFEPLGVEKVSVVQ